MNDGTTPLILAAKHALPDIAKVLMKAGAKAYNTDSQGKTALHWAAAVNSLEVTQELLKNNAKKDARDSMGQTPLFLGASEGSVETVRYLLINGADRSVKSFMEHREGSSSPEHIAELKLHMHVVELLRDYSLGCDSSKALPSSPHASATSSPFDRQNGHPAKVMSKIPIAIRPKTISLPCSSGNSFPPSYVHGTNALSPQGSSGTVAISPAISTTLSLPQTGSLDTQSLSSMLDDAGLAGMFDDEDLGSLEGIDTTSNGCWLDDLGLESTVENATQGCDEVQQLPISDLMGLDGMLGDRDLVGLEGIDMTSHGWSDDRSSEVSMGNFDPECDEVQQPLLDVETIWIKRLDQ